MIKQKHLQGKVSKLLLNQYDLEVPKYINIDGYLKDPLRMRSNHVRNSKSIYH